MSSLSVDAGNGETVNYSNTAAGKSQWSWNVPAKDTSAGLDL